VWFFLYESRTLSLENVDRMYGEPGLKAWQSSKWTPPGYITRKQRDDSHDGDDDATLTGMERGASYEKKHSGAEGGGVPSEARVENAV